MIARRPRLVAVAGALLAAGLLAASCSGGGGDEDAAPEPTEPTTTTTAAPLPTYPLTGLPGADADVLGDHPAVSVKMDNSPEARPQAGLNQADVVYELLVEGITRFAVIFHSEMPDPVGPVRSARSSDIDLVADLSTPLFAWSGGNLGVTDEVLRAARDGILTNASYDVATASYYRSADRKAPHNLYLHLPQLLESTTPDGQGAPAPLFLYREADAAATGTPAAGVSVDFGLGVVVDYAWDAGRGGWARFQVDARHPRPDSATVDADGVQVSPANVVVLFTDYVPSPADARSPMALSVGEGDAIVFTGGTVVTGRWSRPDAARPAELVTATGEPILLTPGRTWVEMPRTGSSVTVLDQPTADGLLAVRR